MNFETPNNTDNTNPAKKLKLEKVKAEVEGFKDALNLGMDEGIKDTVIYLKALGYNTSQSCEGHLEMEGQKWNHIPYVSFEAVDMPEYRYEGQQEIYERIASENNISVDDINRNEEYESLNTKAWDELSALHGKGDWPMTQETVDWVKRNTKLYKDLEGLLDEFYKDRKVEEENKLVLTGNYKTSLRITNNAGIHNKADSEDGFIYSNGNEVTGSDEEIAQKIENWQGEMKAFTEFLKNKFLTQ